MQGLFVLLAWFAFIVEFGLFGAVIEELNDPGRVSLLPGQVTSLTGAPGDTIHLILPVTKNPRADYSELSANLRAGAASAEEILLPLNARLDSEDSDDAEVFGTLVVPQAAAGTDLTGRLYGVVRLPHGKSESLNAPFTLHIFADGEGVKSGTREHNQEMDEMFVANVVGVSVVAGFSALALLFAHRSLRQEARQE
jgi:hypothetical protein